MEDGKKRVNFTTEDQDILLVLINKEPILSSLKTDGKTVHLKKEAWTRITDKFNKLLTTKTKRSEKQLIKCYNNIKNRHKSVLAEQKRQTMKTGGGVIECLYESNPTLEMVLGAVDDEIRNVFDSDTIALQNGQISTKTIEDTPHCSRIQSTSSRGSQLQDEQKSTEMANDIPECSQHHAMTFLETKLMEEEEIDELVEYEPTFPLGNSAKEVLPPIESKVVRCNNSMHCSESSSKGIKRTREACIEQITTLEMEQMRELHEMRIETERMKKAASKAKEAYYLLKQKKLFIQSKFMMFEEMLSLIHDLRHESK